jgi:hypothetical protein
VLVVVPLPTESAVHTGEAAVPVLTLNPLSVVLKINNPFAGNGILFC